MPCPKSATVNGQQTVPGPRHRVCVNLICCRLPKKKVSEWAEEGVWQGQWVDEGGGGRGAARKRQGAICQSELWQMLFRLCYFFGLLMNFVCR